MKQVEQYYSTKQLILHITMTNSIKLQKNAYRYILHNKYNNMSNFQFFPFNLSNKK